MFLTQQGGLIIGPISKLLGWILSLIYDALNSFGVVNIGVAIILFTVLIRLCLLPMLFKQNRSTKVMNYIQPELNKITKKYKNKKDQESMLAQQREVREIQDRYGINLSTGCLTSLIQLPIFLALYRVIQNVPAYVEKVYNLYKPIADKIYGNEEAINKLKEFQMQDNNLKIVTLDENNVDTIIDVLAKFSENSWDKYSALLNNQGEIVDAINANVEEINHIYSFIGGINLTSVPGFALTAALAIPVLSMVFQFLSMRVTPQQNNTTDPSQQATMSMMRTMMYIFPVFSFFITVNVPAGVGLYWATGSFVSFLTTVIINAYYKHCDMEKVVAKAEKEAAKKIAKRKAKGKKTFMEKLTEAAYGEQQTEQSRVKSNVANASLKNYTSNTMNSNNGNNVQYRPGSLAAKANAMQRYNDKNNGGKN